MKLIDYASCIRPSRLGGILALLLAVPAWAADPNPNIVLPDFGDSAGSVISPQEEQRLGQQFMRSLRQSVKITDDPETDEYIQSLGYRLVAHADQQAYPFTFFVVEDKTVNAFAGPGGYVGVHSGLILSSDTESELASVLAHEIAHVTQHHLLRAVDQSNRLALPATAALMAALILAGQNAQVGTAAMAATLAGSQQAAINFTRSHELEADRVGLQILAGAGYDPRSMPTFFEQLQQANRFYENGAPEMLRTHPVTTSRIADTRNRAEQYPKVTTTDPLSYQLIRAKLRVLTAKDPQTALSYFENKLDDKPVAHQDARRYGYALALLAAGQNTKAAEQIKVLLKKDPDRIQYRLAQGQLASAKSDSNTALKIYGDALQLYPRNYPLTAAYARELLLAGRPVPARQLLQDYLRTREPRPLVYKLLAQAENDAGAPIESQLALAEFAYLSGQTQTAIDHLNQALNLTKKDDFYRASRIEARLKEIKRDAAPELK
ncbi:MAG: M48 family metalloprotease [Pseudomonadota bacterium]